MSTPITPGWHWLPQPLAPLGLLGGAFVPLGYRVWEQSYGLGDRRGVRVGGDDAQDSRIGAELVGLDASRASRPEQAARLRR